MPIAAIGQYMEAICRYKSYDQFPEGKWKHICHGWSWYEWYFVNNYV